MSAVTRAQAPFIEQMLPPEAYRQAVDQADLAISITDAKANILFANDAFTRVTGYSKDEIVGKNESMLSNHTTPTELYKSMWSDLSAQKPWSGKLLNRRKDGELYLAELSISPVVDATGKTTHFLGMHRDITELHRLERVVAQPEAPDRIGCRCRARSPLPCSTRAAASSSTTRNTRSWSPTCASRNRPTRRARQPAAGLARSIGRKPAATGAFSQPRSAHRPGPAGHAGFRSSSVIDMHSDCADSYFCAAGQPGLLLVIADITNLRDEQERARASALQAVLAEEERTAAIREGLSAAIFRLEEPMNVMASAVSVLQRRDPASAACCSRRCRAAASTWRRCAR